MGGAIQLVTRQVTSQIHNRANISYGSFDTRKVSLYRSQSFAKHDIGYLALFNYTESDGDFDFLDDNGTRFNTRDDEMLIPLATPNPFSDLQYTAALPRGPRILVSSVKDFGALDGGIEAIDPTTVDVGFVLAETAANGNITFFEVVSATQAYAIVGLVDGSFTNALVQFNPSTGELISTLATGLPFTLNVAINNAGELYVGPVDTVSPTPGVLIFDTVSAQEITTEPVSVGALPPGWIVMVEEPQVALTAHQSGTGTGVVSAVPVGLGDPSGTHNFPVDTEVTLTAVPAAASRFVGWQGESCTGTGTCTVTMNQEKAVTAVFDGAQ